MYTSSSTTSAGNLMATRPSTVVIQRCSLFVFYFNESIVLSPQCIRASFSSSFIVWWSYCFDLREYQCAQQKTMRAKKKTRLEGKRSVYKMGVSSSMRFATKSLRRTSDTDTICLLLWMSCWIVPSTEKKLNTVWQASVSPLGLGHLNPIKSALVGKLTDVRTGQNGPPFDKSTHTCTDAAAKAQAQAHEAWLDQCTLNKLDRQCCRGFY